MTPYTDKLVDRRRYCIALNDPCLAFERQLFQYYQTKLNNQFVDYQKWRLSINLYPFIEAVLDYVFMNQVAKECQDLISFIKKPSAELQLELPTALSMASELSMYFIYVLGCHFPDLYFGENRIIEYDLVEPYSLIISTRAEQY